MWKDRSDEVYIRVREKGRRGKGRIARDRKRGKVDVPGINS